MAQTGAVLTPVGLTGARLTPAGQTPLVKGSPLLNGLLAYYPFSDGAGSTVTDGVSGLNGTWEGTLGSQWSTGIIGGAGNFNGTDNDVLLGTPGAMTSPAAFAVAAWVYNTDVPNTRFVFAKDASASRGYAFGIKNASGMKTYAERNGSVLLTGTTPILVSTWTHIVWMWNGTTWTNVVNGTVDVSALAAPPTTSTGGVTIGTRQVVGGTRFWVGMIGPVGVWVRQLSLAEIAILYNNGLGRAYPFS